VRIDPQYQGAVVYVGTPRAPWAYVSSCKPRDPHRHMAGIKAEYALRPGSMPASASRPAVLAPAGTRQSPALRLAGYRPPVPRRLGVHRFTDYSLED
jgi:hypothetical protein